MSDRIEGAEAAYESVAELGRLLGLDPESQRRLYQFPDRWEVSQRHVSDMISDLKAGVYEGARREPT